MELTVERFLEDEDLRARLERRARFERAAEVHRHIARLSAALTQERTEPEDTCHSYASR